MKKAGLILLGLFLILSVPVLWNRFRVENSNRQVEICLDWDGFSQVCNNQFYPEEDFLLRIRELGISSIGLTEKNVKSLKDEGKILTFTKEEKEKMYLLGTLSSSALPAGEVWVVSDKNYKQKIKKFLESKFDKKINYVERGEYLLIGIPEKELNYNELNLGFDESEMKQIKNFGFNIVIKLDNYLPENSLNTESISSISGLYFNQNKKWLVGTEKSQLFWNMFPKTKLFIEEFARLDGIGQILNKQKIQNVSWIRLHRFVDKDFVAYNNSYDPVKKSVTRLVRAVKERNIRVLYLSALPKDWINKGINTGQEENWLELQYRYLQSLKNQLEIDGYICGPAEPFNIKEVKNSSIRKFVGLLLTIIFPFIGIIYIVKRIKSNNNTATNIWRLTIKLFLFVSLLSIVAGLLVSSLLSGNNFLVKIDEFSGVKFALLLPLIFTAVYLYKDYGSSIFKQPLTLGIILILVSLGSVLLLLIVRSGNQAGSLFSQQEENLRNIMETWFFARPRIKEFLFAHPVFILGIYLFVKHIRLNKPVTANNYISFLDYRLFLLLGIIGQISIINSFCHLHTPLSLTLLRTFHGLWLGFVIGYVLIKLWEILERRYKRINDE